MNRIFFAIALAAASAAVGCQTPEPESPAAGLTKPVDPPKPPDLGRGCGAGRCQGGAPAATASGF